MFATMIPGEELRGAVSFAGKVERKSIIQYSRADLAQRSFPLINVGQSRSSDTPAIQRRVRYLTVDHPTTLRRKGGRKTRTMDQTNALLCPGTFSKRGVRFADGLTEWK